MSTEPARAGTSAANSLPAELASARVADLAREHPSTIRVFQRHQIDFCCGGKRTLAEAVGRAGLEPARLADELNAAIAEAGGDAGAPPAPPATLADLCQRIVGRYHRGLRSELPRLAQMAEKVLRVHGNTMPEVLPRLAAAVGELAAELDAHMREEEAAVFPAIERLAGTAGSGQPRAAQDVAVLIAAREDEHAVAGSRLREIRDLTSGFTPPAWACNTFRGLYHGLAELERDLHEHIHLENNILFPQALALISPPTSER